ncbi:MAG: ATP-binding protein [Gammaproteobacteria bacterium]|nr:ATP-binding protein [Gammaproteobacteria bacterium]
MNYGDLIQFDPIESVVQLHEADRVDSARRLVETFVISDRMSEQLIDVVFSQLQFEIPSDNKGIMVVGNYGTGKSHLQAVISAIAEHGDFADLITHPKVAEKAAAIAGRFIVIRAEINSSMPLRQFVMETLQDQLAAHGVDFDVPPEEAIKNHKDVFGDMMAAFTTRFPEQGLLFVLDELLDYLRANNEQELMRNLNFLRAVGEFCKGSRFRFIAGVQESLFDNPRFQFAADSLRRVKDRFEQMRIAREDVAHVVAERLLKKDAKQQALVREHLTPFAPLYGAMNERMDEFVRLFPVHPAYLDTFERVYVAEKREVLKTLSAAIRRLLSTAVPTDAPGLIAYDAYWQNLKDNPSFRSIPEIRDVIEKADVLEARIQQAFTRPQYRPAALRIIHALSVHRLTTSDIFAPIGATVEELRDDLCLILPVPERAADFLKTSVETVLGEILKTVSGQFLSFNRENGQYYLDLKKDIDFDSLIARRADTLSDEQLDRYYFDALRRVVLEDPEAPAYVAGYRIWEHELEWRERQAGRSGYLFFGAPNERSTAQPPRDFYIYFIQPFEPPYFKDERKADEVFFRLTQRDEDFDRALRLYAGAREQALAASGGNKKTYDDKALEHLRTLQRWLEEKLTSAFEVTYQGKPQHLGMLLQSLFARAPARGGVRDYLDVAAAVSLSVHFNDTAPDYPIFSTSITRANRAQAAQDGLRWIAGGVKSQLGTAMLDALEMLDGDQLRPRQSRYSKSIIQQLGTKGEGQVLNRSELVQEQAGGEYWTRFRLEPELLAVVLAGLVHSGDLVLSITGKKIDAGAIDQFAKLPIGDLAQFKHVERPRDLPLGALQELCDLLGVPKGLIVNPAKRDEAVTQIQGKVAEWVNKAVVAQAHRADLALWGKPILSEPEQTEWRQRLGELKRFLESLQSFNTAGKLKSFPHDATVIQAQQSGLACVREVEELLQLVAQVGPTTAYLGKAEAVLEAGHPWIEQMRERRGELMAKITSPKHRADPSFQRTLGQTLAQLKTAYQDVYLDRHARMRLGATDDQRKARLGQDPRLKQLQQLATVEMMPAQQLQDYQNSLFGLKTCFSLTKQDLDTDAVCPHCTFRPVEEPFSGTTAGERIPRLDAALDDLVQSWTKTLLTNMQDPTVAANIELASSVEGRAAVQTFLVSGQLPDPISPAFVKALQEILSGLERVVLTEPRLLSALTDGGTPCTVAEIKQRFEGFVAELTKGKNVARVRFVIEKAHSGQAGDT